MTVADLTSLELRPPMRRSLALLIGCGVFVASGCWLLNKNGMAPYIGWAAVTVFGAGGIITTLQMLPGASFLRANGEGLTVRSLWRGGTIRWTDVERFGVVQIPAWLGVSRKFIGYNYRPGRGPKFGHARFDRGVTTFDMALPDTYGHHVEELAARLESFRQRYGGAV